MVIIRISAGIRFGVARVYAAWALNAKGRSLCAEDGYRQQIRRRNDSSKTSMEPRVANRGQPAARPRLEKFSF